MKKERVLNFAGTIKKRSGWGTAIFLSLIFNWALFTIMPHLISRTPEDAIMLEPVNAVNVIRMKQTEEPVKKKPLIKKQPEEKTEEKTIQKEVFQRNRQMRLKMPFELNTKLPEIQGTVPTLFMEKYAINGLDAYDMGDIDQPISAIVRIPPIYPMRARRLGVEGFVTVKMLVSEKGFVERTEILAAQPEGVFEKSVLQCTSSWRFTPGTRDGVPVKTFVTTTIRFDLENE